MTGWRVTVEPAVGRAFRFQFDAHAEKDAERYAAAMRAARGDSATVHVDPIQAPDVPAGLLPIPEAEAA